MSKIHFYILIVSVLFIFGSCSTDNAPVYELKTSAVPDEAGVIVVKENSSDKVGLLTVEAIPKEEWIFVEWRGDLSIDNNPYTFTLKKNADIAAYFEKRSYPLFINIEGEGRVREEVIKPKSSEYESGTLVRLTALPEEGWDFVEWEGDYQGNEEVITKTINRRTDVYAKFEKVPKYFVSDAPNYNYPNNTVGSIRNNHFYPGISIGYETIHSKYNIHEGCCYLCYCERYHLNGTNLIYLDHSGDDILSLFGWMFNFSNNFTYPYGKFIYVPDVLNQPNHKIYYDSPFSFDARMYLSDFNGDGYDEILIYGNQDHEDGAHSFVYEQLPLKILKFSDNGSFETRSVGPPTSSHDVATGDVNGNGFIDIVNFQWFMQGNKNNNESNAPILYLNDGNGNFTLDDNFLKGLEITQEGYVATAVELFDLNNNGCLDLIEGFYEHLKVWWGDCSGTFDITNIWEKDITKQERTLLGFSFVDYNQDGFYDIAVSSTLNYQGSELQIYKNNGDQSFVDVTSQVLDKYTFKNSDNILSFYYTRISDRTGNGLYDISPFGISSVEPSNDVRDVFWENVGGKFILRGI